MKFVIGEFPLKSVSTFQFLLKSDKTHCACRFCMFLCMPEAELVFDAESVSSESRQNLTYISFSVNLFYKPYTFQCSCRKTMNMSDLFCYAYILIFV
jgi:hypothetical protein